MGRALEFGDSCGVLLYTSLAGRVVGHPDPSMPIHLLVYKHRQEFHFKYVGYSDIDGATITTFASEDYAHKIFVNNQCKDGDKQVRCIVDSENNCAYRANIL